MREGIKKIKNCEVDNIKFQAGINRGFLIDAYCKLHIRGKKKALNFTEAAVTLKAYSVKAPVKVLQNIRGFK